MWIMRAGVRAARDQGEVTGLENVPAGRELHLHVQPRVEPGPAGGAAADSGALLGAAEEGADEDSDAGDGDADGEVYAGGAWEQPGGGAGGA